MRLDENKLHELLFYVEKNDMGDGVEFSDHSYIKTAKFNDDVKKRLLATKNLDEVTRYHLEEMEKRSWLSSSGTDASSTYRMDPQGHEVAKFLRENTPVKRAIRKLGQWLDKAMTSIFMPIVAALLTVLVTKWLGW